MCLMIHCRVDSEKLRVISLRARQYEWPEWEVPEPTPPQWESSPKFGSRLQYCRVVSLRASQKLEVCSLLCRVVSALSRVVSQVWESSPQELESSPEVWNKTVTASFWILTAISFSNCHICLPNGYIADGKYIRTYIQWEEQLFKRENQSKSLHSHFSRKRAKAWERFLLPHSHLKGIHPTTRSNQRSFINLLKGSFQRSFIRNLSQKGFYLSLLFAMHNLFKSGH